MLTKSDYLDLISKRGDPYGGHGGILDLLHWCSKANTQLVTFDEAQRYYEDPSAEYLPAGGESGAPADQLSFGNSPV